MTGLLQVSWFAVLGRLLLAVALGAAIGFDREYSQKAAGLRTNMLVALGAALFAVIPIQSGLVARDSTALARILQGVITGVGFIGAGSVFREERVRGLTSAAAIWISAAIGIAAGLGQWQISLGGTTLALVILRIMKWVEKRF